MAEKIYDSLFDAFRVIAPASPLLQLEGGNGRFFRRTNQYELIDMGDHIAAFPGVPFQLFRGESRFHEQCKAIIYRSGRPDDVILDELRCIEFKNILLSFPQVQYAIEDHMKVDFLALAQHYELNTRLIDVTSEPEIAAYFATQRWINGIPVPAEEGIGCIRVFESPLLTAPELDDPRFHMIGLQCFERPGIQAAFGIEMDQEDDLATQGGCVLFKQNKAASSIIHTNFHLDQSKLDKLLASGRQGHIEPAEIESESGWLFPQEEIADVARIVKNSKAISRASVEEYGKPVNDVLARNGISVSDQPIYVLSEEHRKELEEQYRGRPYGNVSLMVRPVLRKL